jgi:hypothetical protein
MNLNSINFATGDNANFSALSSNSLTWQQSNQSPSIEDPPLHVSIIIWDISLSFMALFAKVIYLTRNRLVDCTSQPLAPLTYHPLMWAAEDRINGRELL